MNNKEVIASRKRMKEVLSVLQTEYPEVACDLSFSSPFELLIATILSAQCTDKRVNIVTKSLFAKYKKPEDYLSVSAEELEQDIYSTGFYKNKSKNIRILCRQLLELHNGVVPDDMSSLVSLAGVGRKTANVVLGNAFGIHEGIVVDTHVTRIMNLLGFATTTNAVKIERELMKLIPPATWTDFTHRIIRHGRAVCIARRPKCSVCKLNHLCPSSLQ